MEFPALFEEPSEIDEKAEPEKKEQAPGTDLVAFSGKAPPVKEIIREAHVLREALDRQSSRPIAMLGEELFSEGFVTREQLDMAIRAQSASKGKRMGEILVETGAVSRDTMDFILARRLGMPSVDLRKLDIDPAALALVPRLLADKHLSMPCLIHRNRLVVAMENPMDQHALKALRFACGMYVLTVLAPGKDIRWAITRYYNDPHKHRDSTDHWV